MKTAAELRRELAEAEQREASTPPRLRDLNARMQKHLVDVSPEVEGLSRTDFVMAVTASLTAEVAKWADGHFDELEARIAKLEDGS